MESFSALYVVFVGFTSAALAGSTFVAISGRKIDLSLSYQHPAEAIVSALSCLFAGPWLLYSTIVGQIIAGRTNLRFLFIGFGATVLWSLFAGIVIVQLYLSMVAGVD